MQEISDVTASKAGNETTDRNEEDNTFHGVLSDERWASLSWLIDISILLCALRYYLLDNSSHIQNTNSGPGADPASKVRGGDFSNIW